MMSKVQLDMTIGHDYKMTVLLVLVPASGATVQDRGKHQAPGMLVRASALPHPTAGGQGLGAAPRLGWEPRGIRERAG